MAEYKQSAIAGTQWHRFARIEIDNPRNGTPSISCSEQSVLSVGGDEATREVGTLRFDFDAAADFPLLDPATNEEQGESWFATLPKGMRAYVLIYSYVLSQAALRDGDCGAP